MCKYPVVCLMLQGLQLYAHVNSKVVRNYFLERTELTNVDRSMGDAYINLKKYNRTLFVMNMNLTLIKSIPDETIMSAAIYKFDSGLYKITAFQVQKNLCTMLSQEYRMIWGESMKRGGLKHFVKQCPIQPGFYYFENEPVPSQWPYTPPWRAMLKVRVFTNTHTLLEVNTYLGFKEHIV